MFTTNFLGTSVGRAELRDPPEINCHKFLISSIPSILFHLFFCFHLLQGGQSFEIYKRTVVSSTVSLEERSQSFVILDFYILYGLKARVPKKVKSSRALVLVADLTYT